MQCQSRIYVSRKAHWSGGLAGARHDIKRKRTRKLFSGIHSRRTRAAAVTRVPRVPLPVEDHSYPKIGTFFCRHCWDDLKKPMFHPSSNSALSLHLNRTKRAATLGARRSIRSRSAAHSTSWLRAMIDLKTGSKDSGCGFQFSDFGVSGRYHVPTIRHLHPPAQWLKGP